MSQLEVLFNTLKENDMFSDPGKTYKQFLRSYADDDYKEDVFEIL